MRARDLDLKELLQFDPDGGTLPFANERVLLLDALALGPLRRELDRDVGPGRRARRPHAVWLRPWLTAENLRSALPWEFTHLETVFEITLSRWTEHTNELAFARTRRARGPSHDAPRSRRVR